MKLKLAIVIGLLIAAAYCQRAIASPYVYYEKVMEEELLRGVFYSSYRQVTNQGMRDIYILKVPTKDPNIKLRPADSVLDFGYKQTARAMLSDTNAIAGINGDMFGIAGSYSNPFGLVVRDGGLRSLNTFSNFEENTYASFFMEDDGNPFILYLKSEIVFLNNGAQNIEIAAKNKITDLNFPVYFDRIAMSDTSSLDISFPDLYKIVISNNVIVQVSGKGESVTIPDNGYIIAMNEKVAMQSIHKFAVGQSAEIQIKGGVDYDKIENAISGAGRIMLDGLPADDTGYVAPRMQPRTAIGITEDKSHIILMVVDGRSHSIGANQEDMYHLMRRFGAYNAMHLDGGGSSTMIVRNEDTSELDVVNTPSDGGERKIINALGVYDFAPVGVPVELSLKASHIRVFKNTPVRITAYEIDEYKHKTPIPRDGLVITASDPGGRWVGEYFYPGTTGTIIFSASYSRGSTGSGGSTGSINSTGSVDPGAYGTMSSSTEVYCVDIGALYPSQSHIRVGVGGTAELSFRGVSNNGYSSYIYNSGVSIQVYPPGLGSIRDGVFVAEANGAGYLECRVGTVVAYIDITVGIFEAPVTSFENLPAVSFMSTPETVFGHAALSGDHPLDGFAEARLSYYFGLNTEGTQAAYLVFDDPLTFIQNLIGIRMHVFGDNSGHWLRAMFKDAEGETIYVDLAKSIDWEGYQEVVGMIPPDALYPITFERLYVVSLANNEEDVHDIYFDRVYGIFEQQYESVEHPEATPYADIMAADLSIPPAEGSFDIVIAGDMKYASEDELTLTVEKMRAYSRLAVYAGETDAPLDIGIGVIKWNSNYYLHNTERISIVQMSSKRGGILATDPSQWLDFITQIRETGRQNVIIIMEKSPLGFSSRKEYEIFHEMLKDVRDSGKNVFVVSTEGPESLEVIEGIRYVGLGTIAGEDFRLLRLRVSQTDITYELQGIDY